jgi:hypothetical protein
LVFGDRIKFIQNAGMWIIIVALLCAGMDTLGLMKPHPDPSNPYPNEPVFGQETLPLAMLALGLFVVTNPGAMWIGLSLAALGFMAWRQSARQLQSVIPVSMAGAVAVYVLIGLISILRGQYETIKRAALLLAFFAFAFLAYKGIKSGGAIQSAETRAWSSKIYRDLFDTYNNAKLPENASDRFPSRREPGKTIDDLESHKLEMVYRHAKETWGDSVVNNIWRLLIWQRMLTDWRSNQPLAGVGIGKTWDYNNAFYPTGFHYETDPSGLNPHNSFLHFLYRFGLIGFLLLLILIATVFVTVIHALRSSWPRIGDPLLEGAMLAFVFCAIFSFFTVALEGPSYAMPFWASLGLLYARARQLLQEKEQKLN